MARRLDLDFAGIDCAIGRDGNVLLFEANPTMLVHLTESHVEYPYKHKYVPRIFDAFGRMLIQRSPREVHPQPWSDRPVPAPLIREIPR